MKSYLALAWKELKAQKITAILILVAVIMSTIMTTVIGQSIGILQSMRIQQAAGLNGNRYATFHQLGKEQAQKLHEDDRLYDVGDTIFIGSTPLGNSSLSLYLREYHDNALSMYPAIGNVKEGRLPEEAIEIALSEDALQYLGLDAVIGDTVSLDLSVSVMDGSLSELEYSADFVLTGILESSYIGYASGTVEGIVGEGTAEELLPEEYLLYSTDFKTYDKQNFQSIIYALAEDLNVDERYIQYNWVLLDAIESFSYMSLLNLFCKFEPAKQGNCHFVAVIDANVCDDLMEQLLVEHLQRLFQLVNQRFQLPHILQHRCDPRFKTAVALYFQLTELLTDLPRLCMINVGGEVSL